MIMVVGYHIVRAFFMISVFFIVIFQVARCFGLPPRGQNPEVGCKPTQHNETHIDNGWGGGWRKTGRGVQC